MIFLTTEKKQMQAKVVKITKSSIMTLVMTKDDVQLTSRSCEAPHNYCLDNLTRRYAIYTINRSNYLHEPLRVLVESRDRAEITRNHKMQKAWNVKLDRNVAKLVRICEKGFTVDGRSGKGRVNTVPSSPSCSMFCKTRRTRRANLSKQQHSSVLRDSRRHMSRAASHSYCIYNL